MSLIYSDHVDTGTPHLINKILINQAFWRTVTESIRIGPNESGLGDNSSQQLQFVILEETVNLAGGLAVHG